MKTITAFFCKKDCNPTSLLKKLLACLIAICFITNASPCLANWLTESIEVNSTPSNATLKNGAWVWGGTTSVKIPNTTVRPFHIMLPKVSASGCGGIHSFWGGFSMLDPDMLVQYAQNVLAAAPSYAFELALQNLCEPCHAIMGHLNKISSQLNNVTLDSCRDAKAGLDFIKDYLPTEAVTGTINSTAKEYLGGVESAIGSFATRVDNIFNKRVADREITSIDKRLFYPELDDHYLSFWVSVVAHKMSNPDFSQFVQPGFEAARNFWSSPADFINFARAITGDFINVRGKVGVNGTNNAGKYEGYTASQKCKPKRIADKMGVLYQDKSSQLLTSKADTATGDRFPLHPIMSIMKYNKAWGLPLPVAPTAAYIQPVTGQGYSGFNGSPNPATGEFDLPNQELSVHSILNPEAGCATAETCAENRIQTILNNIRATTFAGQKTLNTEFVYFNTLPVYLFTNKVGLLSVKYPQILDHVKFSLSKIAAYSYVTARLNESMKYMEELLMEGKAVAINLKKQKMEDADVFDSWINDAIANIEKVRGYNAQFMMSEVQDQITNITSNLNYYRDMDNALTRSVTASSFNAIYAKDWR